MNRKFLYVLLFFVALGAGSCQKKGVKVSTESSADSSQVNFPLPGDSTIYGLACEGCTDSVVVLLPDDCSDPITFDILQAWDSRRLYGRPKVGDRIAVIPSYNDSLKADAVINIDGLIGQWCYKVMPALQLPVVDGKEVQLPDSVRQKLMVPREYGLSLRRQWIANSFGSRPQSGHQAEQQPVKYPKLTFYSKWFLWNGKLLLTKAKFDVDKEGNATLADGEVDTAQIVYLRRDSLVLQIGDSRQSFYRKGSDKQTEKK